MGRGDTTKWRFFKHLVENLPQTHRSPFGLHHPRHRETQLGNSYPHGVYTLVAYPYVALLLRLCSLVPHHAAFRKV